MAKTIMTVDEAIHTMRERSNVTQRRVAELTGIPESTLSRKLNMYDDGAELHVRELTPVMRAFRDMTPLHVLCRSNGGMFVRAPRGRSEFEEDLGDFQENFSRLFKVLYDFAQAPSAEGIKAVDEECVEHMNRTANIRAGARSRASAQFEIDFTDQEA